MVKRKKEDKKEPLSSYLQNQLKKTNLKLVDVPGDGNCFFRAIAHQLRYNESHHEQIKQSSVKEVIENPERCKNFVTEDLMSTFQVYQRKENGQITPQYRQLKTHLVSALK